MDPNVTLQWMRDALANEDWETAALQAQHLDEWLSSGGFLPDAWAAR